MENKSFGENTEEKIFSKIQKYFFEKESRCSYFNKSEFSKNPWFVGFALILSTLLPT